MAKTKTKTKAPTPTGKPHHCVNCGQAVKGATVAIAEAVGIRFCCNCGVRVGPTGRCRFSPCPFFRKIPQC